MAMVSDLISIILSVIASLLVDEIKAWFPSLTKRLIAKAVRRLPENCRDRYEEEWQAALQDIPGNLSKLTHAAGCLRASVGIRKIASAGNRNGSLARRCADISVAVILVVVLAPAMFLTALVIKLESPGPVFFRVQRRDQAGRTFTSLRFRTMRPSRVSGTDHFEISRFGSLLRRYSIDQFPLFFSVLKGDVTMDDVRGKVRAD